MPRKVSLRKIVAPPNFNGYKPYGTLVESKGEVELLYEEYEALKLSDYDLMKHDQAAELMGISRPTFARIYESARRKIAKALVETKTIKAMYGNTYMDDDWFVCNDCFARFTLPNKKKEQCGLCNSTNIKYINANI